MGPCKSSTCFEHEFLYPFQAVVNNFITYCRKHEIDENVAGLGTGINDV